MKISRGVILVVLAGGIIAALIGFYVAYFRGTWVAIAPAPELITEVLKKPDAPIVLPEGFTVSLFAENLSKPRDIIRDPAGALIVSEMGAGAIRVLPDDDRNGVADSSKKILEQLRRPHGLAFRCIEESCTLFVAEEHRVTAYDYDVKARSVSRPRKILDLPTGGNHTTRSLLVYKDQLLVSIGSTCNVCHEEDERRATILSVGFDGGDARVFARGLRNAPFLVLHPRRGDIWVTEMGRDFLGDDLPPDEINVVQDGKQYGWPTCFGKNNHDTDFDHNTYFRNPCMEPFETESKIDLPAHSAPLGLSFVPNDGWPEEYRDDLLIAYHGSWNRSEPTGYKIVRARLNAEGEFEGMEDFMTGWLTASGALGRPVDLLAEAGGVLYISDDKAGVVYRVVYRK